MGIEAPYKKYNIPQQSEEESNMEENLIQLGKEKFYNVYAKPFFDSGVFREIYASDRISVVNLAEQLYVLFKYENMAKDDPQGFIMSDTNAIKVMRDNDMYDKFCNEWLKRYSTLEKKIMNVRLDEKYLRFCLSMKSGKVRVMPPTNRDREDYMLYLVRDYNLLNKQES